MLAKVEFLTFGFDSEKSLSSLKASLGTQLPLEMKESRMLAAATQRPEPVQEMRFQLCHCWVSFLEHMSIFMISKEVAF